MKVVMYSSGFCPYCIRAERLLHSRGVTQIEKIRIDLDPARRAEMIKKTGRRTVPQIYIGDTHVGGYEDLARLDRSNELVKLLTVQSPGMQKSGDIGTPAN
ncbi:glutaredoxin 3 [Nitrosospira sp. Nl5]|uniref:glutaredoxin 3 n=1 Tax=Nitrosospira sp. Nl5 TaxID=200120 RepID=UPI000888FB04|nr:glutaredoxin 3 [Nitrosospira sp. Nl5]SCY78305.1 glutaredoxin 3 [Nitrosospira sp. Nl5]